MTRTLGFLWAFISSWALSWFIHATDAKVNGMGGISEPSILVSVTLIGMIILGPVWLCSLAHAQGGWIGFARTVIGLSLTLGLVVALLGFGGSTKISWLVAFLGMSGLFALSLSVAALPSIWVRGLKKGSD